MIPSESAGDTFFGVHGTILAGAAAARANNGEGIAGIGYNCQLDVVAGYGIGFITLMSQRRDRVVNLSWYTSCSPNTNEQIAYNEIYENGTLVVCGAGNGYYFENDSLKKTHCDLGPIYPAAYDHHISVTSVGSDVTYGVKSWWPGLTDSIEYNWMDVHELIVGDVDTVENANTLGYPIDTILPVSVHNHNESVDICAPGYSVRGTYPDDQYVNGWGTSFASSLVAGTAALMISANKCLTPYQVEYGLKTTADNIYNILENQKYVGKLGAGRVDAGAAVSWAANHDCNSSYTTTMYIRGIEYNTNCAPACATICEECGAECAKHEAEHCQRCAEACQRCAEECRKMAA